MKIEEIKQLSIIDYLQSQGITVSQKNRYFHCKSPFSRDTNWSFLIYPDTNSFYDWSVGFGGSIIDLAMKMHGYSLPQAMEHLEQGNYKAYQANYKATKPEVKKHFEYSRYLTTDVTEIEAIKSYAASRGMRNGFEYGVFNIFDNGNFLRKPSVMFLHRDINGLVTGAKFRDINPKDSGSRFSARGNLGFYILEYVDTENYGPTTVYVVEGEANANSLWQYFQEIKKNVVVISFGGVGNLPKTLPEKYKNVEDKRLIVDYDGNEVLYNTRIKNYEPYELQPIKLLLDKGSDINSLYCSKQMDLIKHLLL